MVMHKEHMVLFRRLHLTGTTFATRYFCVTYRLSMIRYTWAASLKNSLKPVIPPVVVGVEVQQPVRLRLSVKSASQLAVFFSQKKPASSTFSQPDQPKRTG
jgi:hypothetical protein